MIGKAYRQFGQERGMKYSDGICYGELNGFMTTLNEGNGYKDMFISALCSKETIDNLMAESMDIKKKYRLMRFEVNTHYVYITFSDGIGAMKRINAFTDEFMPQLRNYGVIGANICPECGNPFESGFVTKMIMGHAVRLHAGCADEIVNQLRSNEEELANTSSNAGKGILGSVLFGIIGAIPWAIVYALGWFVAWLGALIGFMVVKGYQKFGGVVKKSVIPVFAVIMILCVIFGQFLGDAITLGYYIQTGEADIAFSEIPSFIIYLLQEEPEYKASFIGNIIIGIIFAGVGVFGIFRGLISSVSSESQKVKDLEN